MLHVFAPNGDDWVSTLVLRDGRVMRRRFSPGSMPEEDVLRISIHLSGVAAKDVLDATIRRASDATVEVPADDHFDRLMRRIRECS
jgi:hypothetical protein